MPAVRHRGSGRSAASPTFCSMAERWDSAWSSEKTQQEWDFSGTEHWKWLAPHLRRGARILEAGCGPGQWVYSFDKVGYEAYGVDFAQETIERARRRWPHLRLTVGDLRRLDFGDGYFDAIISLGAVEHDANGPEASLKEMYRVLRPDGLFYCTVPCLNRIHTMGLFSLKELIVCNPIIRRASGRNPAVQFFEYAFRPDEYQNILQSIGFEIISMLPLAPYDGWRRRTIVRKVVDSLHRYDPFLTCHMIAGLCRKPL